MISQEIRYCTTADGVRIAWASSGEGPPLVKAANWLNHLEFDWESPVWRHVMEELSTGLRLVRYDQRGNGLSDWDVEDISFEAFLSDLEAVVDAAGLDRFSLLGISQGCAHSIAYAVRHPERVDKLVLHGGYAAGHNFWSEEHVERRKALGMLMRQGWGEDNPAFRQVFSAMFLPDGDHEAHDAWNELQRIATPRDNALRIAAANGASDVRHLLGQVKAPTLVLHCRDEIAVPFECAREVASGIPDARLVSLDSRNHVLLETDSEWPRWIREVKEFLGVEDSVGAGRREAGPRVETTRVPADATLPPGQELRNYRIERHLASGGMGAVYRARDLKLQREVAIKVLPPDLVDDAGRRARFEREARLLAALNHPHIAAIYGLEEVDTTHFIVMELVDGPTLQRRLQGGPLPVGDALETCRQIAEAMAAAHSKDIVHRDLKPSNVMLTGNGVKLLDFGIAKAVLPGAGAAVDPASQMETLTATGVLMGTGPYMSPEQVRGQPVDKASDAWAFGCVLYETLVGHSPFARETLADTLTAVLEHEPDWGALPARTPRPIRELLRATLQKDPTRRPADFSRIAAGLRELTAAVSGPRGLMRWLRKPGVV
jgi:pimeloyl-ACP methyl ester carboxylesterase/tRNA A-37 threonylcarbamoyl transferase component Bud32